MTGEERFKMQKSETIKKLYDAIEKGLVDKQLIGFLKKYNRLKNTYTTSSCAGRILLIGLNAEEQKKPKLFIGKWHRQVKLKEVFELLKKESNFEEIWLKQEPFIFHFVTKDLDTAKKILDAKIKAGIKRGGIQTLKDGRYVIEIVGMQYMSLPVKIKNKILFNKKQLGTLIRIANRKVKRNYTQLKKFMKLVYDAVKTKRKKTI